MMEENLPEGWTHARLQDAVYPGYTRRPNESNKPDFLYVDIEALDNHVQRITAARRIASGEAPGRARLVIHTGDVIFSLTRPYLKNIAIVPPELDDQIASTAYCVMRPENGVSSHFIFYFVSRDDFIKSIVTYGDSPPAAHDDEFLTMEIPVAPTNEQHRIVAAIEQQFTRLDAAVASLRSAQAKSKQYRASLLKAAVEGELTKEWRAEHPTKETGTQLLVRILAERRARWEEVELAKMRERGITPRDNKWRERYEEPQGPDVERLPELPEGWCWSSLEQLTSAIRPICYGILMPKENLSNGIPYVKVKDMKGDRVDLEALHRTSPEIAAAYSRSSLKPKDLLLAIRGTYGRVAEVPNELEGANITQDTARLDINRQLSQPYMAIHLRSPVSQDFFHRVARGVAVKGVNIADVKLTPIMLPPRAEQTQIVAEVEAKLSNIIQLEITIENDLKRAEHERHSILQEAFAGRLMPQDPDDEPASVLLERIREERKKREEAEKVMRVDRKGNTVDGTRRRRIRRAGAGQAQVGLYKKLVEAGRPLPPDDLFKQVDLKVEEQPGSVGIFYGELEVDVKAQLIKETRPDYVSVLLEALEPSTEALDAIDEVEVANEDKDEGAPGNVEQPKAKPTLGTPSLWDSEPE